MSRNSRAPRWTFRQNTALWRWKPSMLLPAVWPHALARLKWGMCMVSCRTAGEHRMYLTFTLQLKALTSHHLNLNFMSLCGPLAVVILHSFWQTRTSVCEVFWVLLQDVGFMYVMCFQPISLCWQAYINKKFQGRQSPPRQKTHSATLYKDTMSHLFWMFSRTSVSLSCKRRGINYPVSWQAAGLNLTALQS